MPELLLILVIALIVFGPKKLPEVGRSLGKAMREFKRTTEDIKGKFEEQLNAEEFKDIKSGLDDIKAGIKSAAELPAEIKDLGKDLNAPLTAPAPPAVEPAPVAGPGTPAQPEADASGATRVAETGATGAGAPAQAVTDAAGATRVEKPDSPDPASQHGEG